jgi:diguanylate cyclase (GGDEF)-like protein
MLPLGLQHVNIFNYLGVGYLWAKHFHGAETAFRTAEELGLQYGKDNHELLPRSNLAGLECVRLFHERYLTGALPATDVLRRRLNRCAALLEDSSPIQGLPGAKAILQRCSRCAWVLLHCWEGDLDEAQAHLDIARTSHRAAPRADVSSFLIEWAFTELCWARNDLTAAQLRAQALIEFSASAEFEQMVLMGHQLLAQIHWAQRQPERAREVERMKSRRMARIRTEILDNRRFTVDAHLETRMNRQRLQTLSKNAQEFERLSFEDPLTGIANRRRLEQQLSAALAAQRDPGKPLCLALIDLDDFKQVNDRYSHVAGDDVLKTVAQSLRTLVREVDLPARLGGDEFVVLFPQTDAETARQICERIKLTVEQQRWAQWSPLLHIGLSFGVAQSLPQDTPADLIERADAQMFRAKARHSRHAVRT